ncbi:MAG: paraquat-inducible protein A [Parashewanella sp.]
MHHNADLQSIALCHSCDLAISKSALPSNVRALCPRCHTPVYDSPYCTINGILALCITALILTIPAFFLPILELHFLGSIRSASVVDGAMAVIHQGYWIVGISVILAAVVAPFLLLISVLAQVLIIKFAINQSFYRSIYRWLLKKQNLMKQFSMPEIYIISLLVTTFNLGDFADMYFGLGTLCYTLLFIIMIFLQREYKISYMWRYLND